MYLLATADAPLPTYVIDHPWGVWLVGPLFAALAGVSFKEVSHDALFDSKLILQANWM